jgi:hypothetical protein
MARQRQERLSFANEGVLISVLPDARNEMEILHGGVGLHDTDFCREQRE